MIKLRFASQKPEGQGRKRKYKSNKGGHELIITELGVRYTVSTFARLKFSLIKRLNKELNS